MSAAVPLPPAASAPPGRFPVALALTVEGDLRFLAHHDELRAVTLALIRARWPVAYSHGHNPQPRVRIPLPRNLGVAAAGHWVLVDLDAPRAPQDLFAGLAAALPPGLFLERVVAPAPRATPHPQLATYELTLDPTTAAALAPRVAALRAAPRIPIERTGAPGVPPRPLDLRPYLDSLDLVGDTLTMRLRFVAQRTARPTEILQALGLSVPDCGHRLRRTAVQWDMELAGPEYGPQSVTKGTEFV